MAIEAKFKMSQESIDNIRDELYYLETVREKEVSEQIREARSFGDLSENSEYDEAKTEQGKLYSKIAELRNILENCEIIGNAGNSNTITLGSRIKVECMDDGEVEQYQIVGSQEAKPALGRISDDSPFGSSLIGCVAGDIVTVIAPAGEIKYKIISVENK